MNDERENTQNSSGAERPVTPPPLEEALARMGGAVRSDAAEDAAAEAAAGAGEDEDKGRRFPCEQCGADLVFHIGQQELKCPYCGHEKEIVLGEDDEIVERDLLAALEQQAGQRAGHQEQAAGVQVIRCTSCGAEVEFTGTLTSTHCAYCGAPMQKDQIAVRDETRLPVDGVLPFHVSRDDAHANLRKWLASRWFAPNDFTRGKLDGRLSGVYLPYWTYDSMTFNRYTGQRGEYYYVTVGSGKNKRRERRTRWYPASGAFQRFFDDVLVVAATGLPLKILRKLEPWPLNACLPFNQEVLAGYLARTYDVELGDGLNRAREIIDAAIRGDVRGRIGGDTQRIHSIDTRHDAMTYKHLLLPVWLLAHRYKDKIYQLIVNAGTGEVQGQRPWSFWKIFFLVLGILALIGGMVGIAALTQGT